MESLHVLKKVTKCLSLIEYSMNILFYTEWPWCAGKQIGSHKIYQSSIISLQRGF